MSSQALLQTGAPADGELARNAGVGRRHSQLHIKVVFVARNSCLHLHIQERCLRATMLIRLPPIITAGAEAGPGAPQPHQVKQRLLGAPHCARNRDMLKASAQARRLSQQQTTQVPWGDQSSPGPRTRFAAHSGPPPGPPASWPPQVLLPAVRRSGVVELCVARLLPAPIGCAA